MKMSNLHKSLKQKINSPENLHNEVPVVCGEDYSYQIKSNIALSNLQSSFTIYELFPMQQCSESNNF